MNRPFTWRRRITAFAGFFAITLLVAPSASAGIIGLQSAQTCSGSLIGTLPTSETTVVNGVYCDTGGVGYSLTKLLNGDIKLWIGDSTTPKYQIYNDTGAPMTSLTLNFYGSLASNAFIDMQRRDPFQNPLDWNCTGTDTFGITSPATTNCSGTEVDTGQTGLNTISLTWFADPTTGTGFAAGQTFNIWTASFAHAGGDSGYFAPPPPPPPPVPDGGATAILLGLALGALGLAGRRRN